MSGPPAGYLALADQAYAEANGFVDEFLDGIRQDWRNWPGTPDLADSYAELAVLLHERIRTNPVMGAALLAVALIRLANLDTPATAD